LERHDAREELEQLVEAAELERKGVRDGAVALDLELDADAVPIDGVGVEDGPHRQQVLKGLAAFSVIGDEHVAVAAFLERAADDRLRLFFRRRTL